jgi:hypothetical protein
VVKRAARCRAIDLRSRRGNSEPLAFVVCFPIWWFGVGIVLVLGMWLWSMAINVVSLNLAGQAQSVGIDGESRRRSALAAGLGGFASDYAAGNQRDVNGRGIAIEIDRRVAVRGFVSPDAYMVRQRVVVRREQFHARGPEDGWE